MGQGGVYIPAFGESARTKGSKVEAMGQFARVLIVVGLVIAGTGVLLWVGDRFGLGRLPGDLIWKQKGFTVYFPLVTSLVLSVVLTIVLNLLSRK